MGLPVSTIRNLGPASEKEYSLAGINDAETLRELGADEGYKRLLQAGIKPHFIGYYALVMGLQGRPWNDCQGSEKETLRIRFDQIKEEALQNADLNSELERFLDRIGVLAKP